jgi:hypothetical protein
MAQSNSQTRYFWDVTYNRYQIQTYNHTIRKQVQLLVSGQLTSARTMGIHKLGPRTTSILAAITIFRAASGSVCCTTVRYSLQISLNSS